MGYGYGQYGATPTGTPAAPKYSAAQQALIQEAKAELDPLAQQIIVIIDSLQSGGITKSDTLKIVMASLGAST